MENAGCRGYLTVLFSRHGDGNDYEMNEFEDILLCFCVI